MSAFSLMHLPMPSYLLNINIVEGLASLDLLIFSDKHTNCATFPQLKKKKKKKNLILTLLTLLAFIPSISAPLCRKTLQSISYHQHFKSISPFCTTSSIINTVSLTCFFPLALPCSGFFLLTVPPLLLLLRLLPYLTNF